MEKGFGVYHPAVNLIFFAGAVVFGMFLVHPMFLLAEMMMSLIYFLMLKGAKGWKFILFMLILCSAIAFINPLLNTRGDTVLFTYLDQRPFTLEALYYGFATGGMFLSITLWFACYNTVMSSDKFIYLFGRFIPAISLILSMVLRLVPRFKTRASVIAAARKCVGKSPVDGTRKDKLHNGMDLLSVLTSWALEDSVVTADSMKSRGYGSGGKRSSFSIYRLCTKDVISASVMAVCMALMILCIVSGGSRVLFIPTLRIPAWNPYTIIGIMAYTVFLSMPSVIHIWEDTQWIILRSRI